MDYCTKWWLVGWLVGSGPMVIALLAGTFVARWAKNYWLAVLFSGAAMVGSLLLTHPVSLVLWNGLRPAICDRID